MFWSEYEVIVNKPLRRDEPSTFNITLYLSCKNILTVQHKIQPIYGSIFRKFPCFKPIIRIRCIIQQIYIINCVQNLRIIQSE